MTKRDPTRLKINKLEAQMMKDKAKLAKLRSQAKPEPVSDYNLQLPSGKSAKLSSLFGKKNELILIHNMGVSCSYCTLWADGFNGQIKHLESRAAFALESPDSARTLGAFQKKRGWNFPVVSSKGSSFRKDVGYENSDGDFVPGVSVFMKKNGKLFRVSDATFGPGDNFCVTWDLFDLLPGGSGDWEPKFRY